MKNGILTQDIKSALSPLESDVLSVLKNHQEYMVREIYTIIRKKRRVASSSVSVILDRLYEKGLVQRKPQTCRGGMRFIYKLRKDKEAYEKSIVQNTVNKLLERFGDNALAYFNERFSKRK